jgi:hypothetical protein
MKTLFIAIIAVLALATAQAQNGAVPFSYDQTLEWSKVDAAEQKKLLSYANSGKYDTSVAIEADSISKTVLVKGVKSRSGKTEDQVWLTVKKAGKEVNYLFALSSLPIIDGKCCMLKITAKRGDSDEF